jgi:hypothetical protein
MPASELVLQATQRVLAGLIPVEEPPGGAGAQQEGPRAGGPPVGRGWSRRVQRPKPGNRTGRWPAAGRRGVGREPVRRRPGRSGPGRGRRRAARRRRCRSGLGRRPPTPAARRAAAPGRGAGARARAADRSLGAPRAAARRLVRAAGASGGHRPWLQPGTRGVEFLLLGSPGAGQGSGRAGGRPSPPKAWESCGTSSLTHPGNTRALGRPAEPGGSPGRSRGAGHGPGVELVLRSRVVPGRPGLSTPGPLGPPGPGERMIPGSSAPRKRVSRGPWQAARSPYPGAAAQFRSRR